jgi:hypothetical protein
MLEMAEKDIKDRILINEKYKKDSRLVFLEVSKLAIETIVSFTF